MKKNSTRFEFDYEEVKNKALAQLKSGKRKPLTSPIFFFLFYAHRFASSNHQ